MSGLTGFRSLSVVDVSGLRGGEPSAQAAVAEQLGRAAREVGFLYVTGHGIAPPLFDNLIDATQRFFALPLARKMEVYIGNSSNHRGYVPEGEEVYAGGTRDSKEAYDLSIDLPADDPDHVAGNPLLGPNQWPALPGFREAIGAYYDAVFGLGRIMLRGFAMAMGESPAMFDAFVNKPPSQLRLVHYPFNPEAKDVVGIGAHSDYECFTLLHATAPGLEVLNGAGVWIDAPPLPGAFIVNIGDMLELWTNGEFIATSHRVRRVREERYSFPLFFNVDYHTRIAPLPQFIRPGRPARSPLVAGEHLHAQNCQSFGYLKRRLERGEIDLPEGSVGLSSFGREAQLRPAPD
jgi:isopenicillin N synthase-like dioxygenase